MNIKLCVECKVPNYKSPTGKNKIHSTVHGKIVGSITRVFLNWKKNKKTFHSILEVLNLLLSQIIKYELQIESFTIKLYSSTSYGLNLLLSNYIIRTSYRFLRSGKDQGIWANFRMNIIQNFENLNNCTCAINVAMHMFFLFFLSSCYYAYVVHTTNNKGFY